MLRAPKATNALSRPGRSEALEKANALSRKARAEALEKARQIRPFIELANRPADFAQLFKEVVPTFNEVVARIDKPVGPPETWSDEEIEAHIEAQKRVEEKLREQRLELAEERLWMGVVLRQLARLPEPRTYRGFLPPFGEPIEFPANKGQRMQLVVDAQHRLHIEPIFSELAALRKTFCEALDGLDASRIRECPMCKKLYWADRTDKPTCGRGGCPGRLRSQRFYETVKRDREQARRLCDTGKSVAEIARELDLSMRKVRRYLAGRKAGALIRLKQEQEAKERR
jgi:hypothetical protein